MPADDLIAARGEDMALMLRGERRALSAQEKTTILQHRISHLADDLVVPTWNAAFVFDAPVGAEATLEILEFANSQLLEFRYYDQLLDDEPASIHSRLQHPRWYDQWIGSGYTRAARRVHSLFIDVNELTDRTENSLTFIGDISHLFSLVAEERIERRPRVVMTRVTPRFSALPNVAILAIGLRRERRTNGGRVAVTLPPRKPRRRPGRRQDGP